MSSSGYLVPPAKDPSQEKLWVETWKRIDRFLPDLRKDLSLEEDDEGVIASDKLVAKSQALAESQEPVQTGTDVRPASEE